MTRTHQDTAVQQLDHLKRELRDLLVGDIPAFRFRVQWSPSYVTIPSARLKQSHKRGGLSSGEYLYSNVRPSGRLRQCHNGGNLLDRGIT